MDILKAIETRRSIAKVQDKAPTDAEIEQIIQAGSWAPTHCRTEPWRFTIFAGEGRQKLQNAWERNVERTAYFKLAKIEGKAFRAPIVIAVWCAAGRGAKNPPIWEDHAAVSACLQNMCLAAHELGLGAIWRSGDVVDMPEVQALCQVGEDTFKEEMGDKILGFLYVGYPDTDAPIPARDKPQIENKISWIKA